MATKKAENNRTAKSSKTAHVLSLLTSPGGRNRLPDAAEETIEKPAAARKEESRPVGTVPAESSPAETVPAAPVESGSAAPAESGAAAVQRAETVPEKNNRSAEDAAGPADSAVPEAENSEASPLPAAPQEAVASPIVEVAQINDELLSEQIRLALERAFAEEMGLEGAASPARTPPQKPETQKLEPAPEPVSVPEPAAEVVPESVPETDNSFIVLNVMEKLVSRQAPYYMNQFGLCSCERCAADVRALTLSRLQPHYVAIPAWDERRTLTVFEGRFGGAVAAQLTQSCQTVMDSPRHPL